MKIKTSELTGAALNWAVEEAGDKDHTYVPRAYSTDWAFGGPIIERNGLSVMPDTGLDWWVAHQGTVHYGYGPTPLVAAMRCFVASKLGDEVDVPEELKGEK